MASPQPLPKIEIQNDFFLPTYIPRSITFRPVLPDVETAADKAYHLIREKIINLHFLPGSPIKDTELMKTIGLGRTPIREALKRLEYELLIVSKSRKGTYVREISLMEYEQQVQVYQQLMALAVGLWLKSRTEKKWLDLVHYHELIDKTSLGEMGQLIRCILEFEIQISRMSSNSHLLYLLDQYSGYIRRTWLVLKPLISRDDLYLGDYQRFMDLLKAGELRKAENLMIGHLDAVHQSIVATFERWLRK